MTYIAQSCYTHSSDNTPLDKANQLHQLAKIGIAATESGVALAHPDAAFSALFEVMARLADEVREELDQIEGAKG
ncbi:hypothetical protein ACSSVY_001015 [Roseovarius sp. MBR-51]